MRFLGRIPADRNSRRKLLYHWVTGTTPSGKNIGYEHLRHKGWLKFWVLAITCLSSSLDCGLLYLESISNPITVIRYSDPHDLYPIRVLARACSETSVSLEGYAWMY